LESVQSGERRFWKRNSSSKYMVILILNTRINV
jgi:hypothetical protein